LNVAKLLLDSFLQEYSGCSPVFSCALLRGFSQLSSKTVTESVIDLPVISGCLGKAIMVLLGQGVYL